MDAVSLARIPEWVLQRLRVSPNTGPFTFFQLYPP
jgi:hypothetical protein